MKISDMYSSERPREKLLERGAQALSNSELLAVLLRTGRPGESALDLAGRLLSLAGGRLGELFGLSADYLTSLPGVGPAGAASLLSAFELGRRFIQEQAPGARPVRSPAQIHALLHPRLKGLDHEECWLVLLNRKSLISKVVRLTLGGSGSTVIDIPAIIRSAMENGAASLILVHNHPSGDPTPSRQDIKETEALAAACRACSLKLLDHIIISDHSYFSMCEEKSIDN